jgi:hypothetical protein
MPFIILSTIGATHCGPELQFSHRLYRPVFIGVLMSRLKSKIPTLSEPRLTKIDF